MTGCPLNSLGSACPGEKLAMTAPVVERWRVLNNSGELGLNDFTYPPGCFWLIKAAVPWPSQRQVEQDLLLCHTMVRCRGFIFAEPDCDARRHVLQRFISRRHRVTARTLIWLWSVIARRGIFAGHQSRLSGVLGTPKQSVVGATSNWPPQHGETSRVLDNYAIPSLMEPGTEHGNCGGSLMSPSACRICP